MKKYFIKSPAFTPPGKIAAFMSCAVLLAVTGSAQMDTRLDNIGYYQTQILAGRMAPNPLVTIPPAIPSTSSSPSDGTDVVIIDASDTGQSENSIAIDPNNNNSLLNSNNSYGTGSSSGTLYGADGYMSSNNGNTWGGSYHGVDGPGGDWGDPAVAIDRNGKYFAGYITQGGAGESIAYSTNQGTTWTSVSVFSGATLDKNHLAIDNSTDSPYEGSLYDTWTNFSLSPGQIQIAKSTNGAVSWSAPVTVSTAVNAGSHNQGVNIQTGPNGEVYAVWAIYDSWPSTETALGFTSSTNGGSTFSTAARIISSIKGIRGTLKGVRVNSFPSMAVDGSNTNTRGNIYVVWANQGVPGVNSGNDVDVYMIKSVNGGSTWSSPLRVNQDPINQGKKHYLPWVTCDRITGAVSIVSYDDRNSSSTNVEAYAANSLDGGATWADFRVSDVSFTPTPVPGLASGYFGDYLGIEAQGSKVYPCWTDNRSGRTLTYVSPYSLCAGNLNITYPVSVQKYYESSNVITATTSITSSSGYVKFDAGASIQLLPGFSTSVTGAGDFEAYIDGCGNITGTSQRAEHGNDNTSYIANALAKQADARFKLYPNPSNGSMLLEYELEEGQSGEFEIYDLLGKKVANYKLTEGENTLSVEESRLNQGIYIYRISVAGQVVKTAKISIIH
jgi:hypothetical protein